MNSVKSDRITNNLTNPQVGENVDKIFMAIPEEGGERCKSIFNYSLTRKELNEQIEKNKYTSYYLKKCKLIPYVKKLLESINDGLFLVESRTDPRRYPISLNAKKKKFNAAFNAYLQQSESLPIDFEHIKKVVPSYIGKLLNNIDGYQSRNRIKELGENFYSEPSEISFLPQYSPIGNESDFAFQPHNFTQGGDQTSLFTSLMETLGVDRDEQLFVPSSQNTEDFSEEVAGITSYARQGEPMSQPYLLNLEKMCNSLPAYLYMVCPYEKGNNLFYFYILKEIMEKYLGLKGVELYDKEKIKAAIILSESQLKIKAAIILSESQLKIEEKELNISQIDEIADLFSIINKPRLGGGRKKTKRKSKRKSKTKTKTKTKRKRKSKGKWKTNLK